MNQILNSFFSIQPKQSPFEKRAKTTPALPTTKTPTSTSVVINTTTIASYQGRATSSKDSAKCHTIHLLVRVYSKVRKTYEKDGELRDLLEVIFVDNSTRILGVAFKEQAIRFDPLLEVDQVNEITIKIST